MPNHELSKEIPEHIAAGMFRKFSGCSYVCSLVGFIEAEAERKFKDQNGVSFCLKQFFGGNAHLGGDPIEGIALYRSSFSK
jgi:hypothetical protein